jgi:hypothetical protein
MQVSILDFPGSVSTITSYIEVSGSIWGSERKMKLMQIEELLFGIETSVKKTKNVSDR